MNIIYISLNWINAFKSSRCPGLLTIVIVDINLECYTKIALSYHDYLIGIPQISKKLFNVLLQLIILFYQLCCQNFAEKEL